VAVYPLGFAYISPRSTDAGLVLGYANLSEGAIEEGVRRLAGALAEVCPLGGRDSELACSAAGSSGSGLDE
jgi:hypothetical protein